MLVRHRNVRAVAAGATVHVVLVPETDDADGDKASPKVAAVVAKCKFKGNVKITRATVSETFPLHLLSEQEITDAFSACKNSADLVGWEFEELELLETPTWHLGFPRKDLGSGISHVMSCVVRCVHCNCFGAL